MKKSIQFVLLLGALLSFAACSEKDDTWDPYYNWRARNIAWFSQVADTARTAIAHAKAVYGTDWESHCDWRMYKSLLRNADKQGPLSDSICVHILQRGAGSFSPAYTDQVRLNFRGWTMSTEYLDENGEKTKRMEVFTQTYYGDYDPQTALPQVMAVGSTIEGYSTALQYMVAGDDWLVYIPSQLGYGENKQNAIPANSTLLFRLSVMDVFEGGTTVPAWK